MLPRPPRSTRTDTLLPYTTLFRSFGTGNYHPVTAKIYTDISFFSCDPALGRDATRLFNYMTGYATPKAMEKIAFAPLTLREKLLQLIEDEIGHARAGLPASIWIAEERCVGKACVSTCRSRGSPYH